MTRPGALEQQTAARPPWSDSRRLPALEAVVGIIGLLLFVGYFGLYAYRYTWNFDAQRHCAAVASLYRDFWHPRHEAMDLPGSTTDVYTPYIVAVAAVGKLLGQSPYQALQLAGVLNLLFYAVAIWLFFRTFSVSDSRWLPPILFLVVSLFLRNNVYHWASETSFASLRVIQAYPSMFGWSLAILLFCIAEWYFRRPRRLLLVALTLLIATLLLSHFLSGSWALGLLGVRGLIAIRERRRRSGMSSSDEAEGVLDTRQNPSPATYFLALLAGLLLPLLWPYFQILGSAATVVATEGSRFGDHAFRDFGSLYLLAAVAAAVFLTRRQHFFLIVGFAYTAAVFFSLHALGIEYGNRFAFFQAFFAQAIVADLAAIGLHRLIGWRRRIRTREPRAGWSLAFLAATLILTATAPALRRETAAGRPLLSVRDLLQRPASERAYYRRLSPLTSQIAGNLTVMMPVDWSGFDVASITGASVVLSPFAYRAPGYQLRLHDVRRFFSMGVSKAERDALLSRYGASLILVPWSRRNLLSKLDQQYDFRGKTANGKLFLFYAHRQDISRGKR